MAERTISTRLVLAGESEYRAAIKQINAEYQTLKSALKLVDSQFKGQANTLAALEAKNKALNDVISKVSEKLKTENDALKKNQEYQKQAATSIEETKAKIAAKTAELEKLRKSTDDTTKEEQALTEEIVRLNAELNKSVAAEKTAAAAVEKHQTAANKAQTEVNNLNGELSKNNKYLDEAKTSTDKCAKSIDEFGKETQQAASQATQFGDKTKQSVDALASALAAAGIAATVKEIAEALMAAVQASREFESAMAGVAKTTNLSGSDLADMGESIKGMSLDIPLTTTELAKIGEVAGQLGVANKDLLSFTEVMANLGVATNLTSEEAATMLAQFAAITGMDTSQYSNLGAAIVDLGNNFATNEQRIVEMSQSIAAAATNAGIAESDMLALSTAVTSLGIETQAGGTSMSKLIMDMQTAVETGKGLNDWAKAAGMSATEFAALWGQDATAAIQAFIKGLSSVEGGSTVMLDTLGITETRMVRMINSLMNAESASGTLTNALKTSKTAWAENTALVKEAETRYATTESKIKLFNNSVNNLGIAVGDELTPALGNLAEVGQDVAEWATEVVKANPELVKFVAALVAASVAFVGMAGAAVLTTKAVQALSAAMTANPWTIWASAIAAVVAALITLVATSEETDAKLKAISESTKETAKTYEDLVASIESENDTVVGLISTLSLLSEKENKTASDKKAILDIIDQLNEKIPELGLAFNETTQTINKTIDSVLELARAQYEAAQKEAETKRLTDLYTERYTLTDKITEAEKRLKDAIEAEAEARTKLSPRDPQDAIELGEYAKAVQDAKFELEGYNALLETNATNLTAAGGSVAEFNASLEENISKLDEDNASFAQGYARVATEITAQLDALAAKQAEVYKEAYDGISQTVDGFDRMGKTAPTSIKKVTDALQSQIDFMDTYGDNIKKAAELGIDEGLLATLSDGSVESANILAGIVADGGKHIGELNEKFKGVETGKQDYSNIVTDMRTKSDTEFDAIKNKYDELIADFDQSKETFQAGADTVQGLINGLKGRIDSGELERTGAEAAAAFEKGYKAAMEQKSPSKKMERDAEDTVQGLIIGYQNKLPELYALLEQAGVLMSEKLSGKDAFASAYASVGFGPFDEKVVKTEDTIDDLIDKVKSQEKYLTDYSDNLNKAMSLDLDATLLAELADGSEKSAEYLQIIVNSGAEKIQELNAELGKVSEGKLKFAGTVGSMSTYFNGKAKDIEDRVKLMVQEFNQSAAAEKSGNATIQGLIDGINAKIKELKIKAGEVNGIMAGIGSGDSDGSHAAGLSYVPYDDYTANLHRGERVLTALENKAYMADQITNNYSTRGGVVVNIYPREMSKAQSDYLVDKIDRRFGGALA